MPRSIRIDHPPSGFDYHPQMISSDEEFELVEHIRQLPLREFEFQGYLGKRRITSFGWRYDFGDFELHEAEPVPDYLLPVRQRAASFARLSPEDFVHVLVTEYRAGTPIGWHRDRDVFGHVVGVSLLSSCIFRFRHRAGTAWQRHSAILEPRSMYLLSGSARHEWEHSIPPVEELRYSITFRTLRSGDAPVSTQVDEQSPQLSFDFI